MDRLVSAYPSLGPHVIRTRPGGPALLRPTVDYGDPAAVRALNAALLVADYGASPRCYADILPADALVPPVPGRVDYVHHVADLLWRSLPTRTPTLDDTNAPSPPPPPTGSAIVGMDIGTGASCIYPTVAASAYGWRMIASEIHPRSVASAMEIVEANGRSDLIDVRRQELSAERIFDGVLRDGEMIDFAMCNPPFYPSAEAFRAENARKVRGLARGGLNRAVRPGSPAEEVSVDPEGGRGGTPPRPPASNNFGGTDSELWCKGGEVAFVRRMVSESKRYADKCMWFSSLVSRKDNLKRIEGSLFNMGKNGKGGRLRPQVQAVERIRMGAGRKGSTILAWSFLDENERMEWARMRGWAAH